MKKLNVPYWQKLQDPRWQKKRLKILERADWTCENCIQPGKSLQVHHEYYEKNLEPWDYDADTLIALCEECHEERQCLQRDFKLAMARLMRNCGNDQILEACEQAMALINRPLDPEGFAIMRAGQRELLLYAATTVAETCGVSIESVI